MSYDKEFLRFMKDFIEYIEAREAAAVAPAAPPAPVVPEAIVVPEVPAEPVAVATPVVEDASTEAVIQMPILDFAKAVHISMQEAYDFARKHEGKLAYKVGETRKRWMINEEAIKLFKKPARKKPAIAVYCEELGKTFESAYKAAKITGVSYTSVKNSMSNGKAVRGLHFSAAR